MQYTPFRGGISDRFIRKKSVLPVFRPVYHGETGIEKVVPATHCCFFPICFSGDNGKR